MSRVGAGFVKALAFVGLTVRDLKMSVRSALFTFLGIFVPGLLNWLTELTKWAPGKPFPDTSGLGTLAISGVAAAFAALVTLIWRGVEGKTGKAFLRTNPPKR